jgi:hypothetical protein
VHQSAAASTTTVQKKDREKCPHQELVDMRIEYGDRLKAAELAMKTDVPF